MSCYNIQYKPDYPVNKIIPFEELYAERFDVFEWPGIRHAWGLQHLPPYRPEQLLNEFQLNVVKDICNAWGIEIQGKTKRQLVELIVKSPQQRNLVTAHQISIAAQREIDRSNKNTERVPPQYRFQINELYNQVAAQTHIIERQKESEENAAEAYKQQLKTFAATHKHNMIKLQNQIEEQQKEIRKLREKTLINNNNNNTNSNINTGNNININNNNNYTPIVPLPITNNNNRYINIRTTNQRDTLILTENDRIATTERRKIANRFKNAINNSRIYQDQHINNTNNYTNNNRRSTISGILNLDTTNNNNNRNTNVPRSTYIAGTGGDPPPTPPGDNDNDNNNDNRSTNTPPPVEMITIIIMVITRITIITTIIIIDITITEIIITIKCVICMMQCAVLRTTAADKFEQKLEADMIKIY